MAATVTAEQQEINDCDSTLLWNPPPNADTEVYIEGSASCSEKVSKSAYSSDCPMPLGTTDLSDTGLYIWVLGSSIAQFAPKAAGGIGIRVTDSSAHVGTWYVAGSDEGYSGGWQCMCIRTTQAFDSDPDGCDLTNIDYMGIYFNVAGSAAKDNVWWDRCAYGTGIRITGGFPGSEVGMNDIWDAERNYRYGVVNNVEGIYIIQGKLYIGSTVEDVFTVFESIGDTIVFPYRASVGDDWYEIIGVGGTDSLTSINFGEKIGGRGVNGGVIKANVSSPVKLDFSETYLDDFGLYGVQIVGGIDIQFKEGDTYNAEILDCTFIECNGCSIDASVTMTNCLFVTPALTTVAALTIDSTAHAVTNCTFVDCTRGVEIATVGTYEAEGWAFYSCTDDIENSTSGNVVINATNCIGLDTTTETAGGTTNIIQSVSLNVTAYDTTGSSIPGTRIYIEAAPGGTYPADAAVTITRSGTTATTSHSAEHNMISDQWIVIRGANQQQYNGIHQITYVDDYKYTFQVSSTIPATPATGTITACWVAVNEDTDSSGSVIKSVRYIVDQPIRGTARKASSTPYYKPTQISGTIDNAGFSANLIMVGDE